MIIKNAEQIKKLKAGGKILAEVLNLVAKNAVAGVSAFDLDKLAEKELLARGATPSFKNYQGRPDEPAFPASLCVSVNQEVVHGMPYKNKILKEGDIVGLDLGSKYQGLYTDMAVTVGVGKISAKTQKLLDATQESLNNAIARVSPGATTGDIGFATEFIAKKYGFSVVRELVGHGVGLAVHEDPEVPGFGQKGSGVKLTEGLVIAIEPMLTMGKWKIIIANDNWTVETEDKSLAAHFEHTVLVTKNGYEIITV